MGTYKTPQKIAMTPSTHRHPTVSPTKPPTIGPSTGPIKGYIGQCMLRAIRLEK